MSAKIGATMEISDSTGRGHEGEAEPQL
jgi:hypothetical protein